jgi:AraC-like DNA-binding protein
MNIPAGVHEIWRQPGLPEIELQRGIRVADHHIGPHFHDAYQFVLVEAGSRVYRCRNTAKAVGAGELTTILPGEVHAVSSCKDSGSSFLTLHLPTRYVDEIDPASNRRLESVPFIVRDGNTAEAFRRLHSQLAVEAGRADFLLHLSRFLSLMENFVSTRSNPAPDKARVTTAKKCIHTSFRENRPLDEISAAAGLSKYHFVREFTRSVGVSPLAYRNAIRTDEAKQLLCAGRPIKVIAFELGFVDESHFGRIFRQKVGLSPGAYRRAVRSGRRSGMSVDTPAVSPPGGSGMTALR